METISISKFKATCLELLDRVQKTGQPSVVTRRGQPIAQICAPPAPPRKQSLLGCMLGKGQILGDLLVPLEVEWDALRE